jgi:hypothetical protein
MAEPTASAYLTVANALQQIIAIEFEEEGFTAIRDNLHESLGRSRVDIGIAPVEDRVRESDAAMQETYVEVRFYGLWTQEISPDTVVDPALITGYAERFRDALRRSSATDPGTGEVWYFQVVRITYPNDPTGNKSRFHAQIRAFGNNSGLVETTG